MQVRVARALGVATPTATGAMPPQDVGTLEIIKDAINDCIVSTMARHRFRWSRLEQTITLSPDGTAPESIGGDPRMYAMHKMARGFPSRSTFRSADGSWGDTLRCVNPNYIAGRIARDGECAGVPEMLSFEQLAGGNATNPTWRMIVFPKPDAAYVISLVHRVQAWKMIDDVDAGPWPESVALMLISGAVAALAGGRTAPELSAAEWNARYERELAACIDQDIDMGPPALGPSVEPAWDASYAKLYQDGVEIGS